MRLIEPAKPNQNAHIESFNGRLRDECLSEHWFLNLAYAQAAIEDRQREYTRSKSKRHYGDGLTATVPCMSAYIPVMSDNSGDA